MRIDLNEGREQRAGDVATAAGMRDWQVIFENPDPSTRAVLPWVSHEVPDYRSGDVLSASLTAKYPDQPVWLVGIDPTDESGDAWVVVHVPDVEGVELPTDEQTAAATARARERDQYHRRNAQRRRERFGAAESAKVPAPLPAGPDLADHLYQNKVAFPQHQRADGSPAGELARPDGQEQPDDVDARPFPNPGLVGGQGGGQ